MFDVDAEIAEAQRAAAAAAREAAREALKAAEPMVRETLQAVEENPWGNILFEGIRARVRGEPLPVGTMMKRALDNLLHPPAPPSAPTPPKETP